MRIQAFLQVVLMLLLSTAVQAESDVSGSSDPRQLPRFPLSWIVSYNTRVVPEYALATGPMRKIEGIIAPEQDKRIKGELTRITYRVPDIHTPDQVFNYYLDLLKSMQAKILFQCSSRQCGSSNQWANNYFEVAELYGLDRTQFFLSASAGNLQLALYTVKRGNRRVYIHLDLIEPLKQTAETLAADLQQQGFSWLSDAEQLEPLIDFMSSNPQQKILIASYNRSEGVATAELLELSYNASSEVKDLLVEAGIDAGRIDSIGVGPALPVIDREQASGVWIQLR
ncbi:DUF4892 domain-containing protein [Amphritea pacifica]|uniref:DUF4892 domain-containing protein n=1 Tax=Amphritea pacifica TaxID=2811233 RepID=UPI0019656183|nr:DUF4892 domain-containing protein [Amphritea pacifica]MBN1008765.1 DUF4892 domain-containing protein [Amphritea pacifica]